MSEQPYSKREIDSLMRGLGDKMDANAHATKNKIQEGHSILELQLNTLSHDTRDSLSRIETKQASIEAQTIYTNGKVRKIIMALLLLFGICIGLGFTEAKQILPFLL